VGTKYAKLLKEEETGKAYIMSLKNGDNSIIIVGGANTAHRKDMKELDGEW
jgi:hypothetical protein